VKISLHINSATQLKWVNQFNTSKNNSKNSHQILNSISSDVIQPACDNNTNDKQQSCYEHVSEKQRSQDKVSSDISGNSTALSAVID